ncbi:hypothetical protein PRZ48_008522 [Zasmidium cellare]|uniref:J domain-containing protein n=1 Tax=Zasmidium cellare TaxID=395010 RepID=A0ABR0EGY0_ZASCE|nr:hypothetical protein PRZ48_008522 [Zasmidium cellare]
MAQDTAALCRAYMQVDQAKDSYDTLGLSREDAPTAADIKAAYRALALHLHPDKAPAGAKAQTHHDMFLKIQKAQDDLLKEVSGGAGASRTDERFTIQEGPTSLHQRNLDFKAKLRQCREAAIKDKHHLDVEKAEAKARWEKKSKAAIAKADRAAEKLVAQQGGKITTKQAQQAAHKQSQKQADPKSAWQQSSNKAAVKATKREKAEVKKKQRIPIRKAAQQATFAGEQDEVAATPLDVSYRRNKAFLSGRAGNISLADEMRREKGTMAKDLRLEKLDQVPSRGSRVVCTH